MNINKDGKTFNRNIKRSNEINEELEIINQTPNENFNKNINDYSFKYTNENPKRRLT
jgi:NADH:ubiquinone oxidoreductase subunit D